MILLEKREIENIIFKFKIIFIKQGGKLVFKLFSKQLGFYRSNSETQFCRVTRFTRKLIRGY